MCCHKHPDNGSDLAVVDAKDTDLLAELKTAKETLAAVEAMGRRLKGMGGRYGWLHPYSLSLIVDALDCILKGGE